MATDLFEKTDFGYSLKKKEAEKTFTIEVKQEIILQMIENIIIDAFEGAITYWCGLDNTGELWDIKPKGMSTSQWLSELLIYGNEIKLYDIEDESETWILTLDKLLHGIKLNAEQRQHDSDLNNMDGTTVDCIIQYALFNEVVYG